MGEADFPVTWSRPDLFETVTKGRSSGTNNCNNYGLINIVEYIHSLFSSWLRLNADEDVNRVWENIKEHIKTSAKESLGLHVLKRHKPWLDKEFVGFLDQRKQAKMHWIQDPSRSNVDNLNNVRRGASRHFRNKKKAYLKAKIEEFETNTKIKNIRDLYRGINDLRRVTSLELI